MSSETTAHSTGTEKKKKRVGISTSVQCFDSEGKKPMENEELNTDEERPKMKKLSAQEEDDQQQQPSGANGKEKGVQKRKLKFNKVIDAKEEEEKFKQECAQQ